MSGLKKKVRTCLFLKAAAREAAHFYVSVVPGSEIEAEFGAAPDGSPLVVEFTLAGAPYMTLNGNPEPTSSYLSSISVLTEDQAETDDLWSKLLTDDGEEGQCGWLKDRFGVYWQIVPKALPELMHTGDPAVASRVTNALMQMQKIDVAKLRAAADGV